MTILHIISSGGMYGAEAVILNMSRTLNDSGHHRSILGVFSNSAQPNLQLLEVAKSQGIETHAIPCKGQVDLSVPAAIRALVQTTRADVVHAHGYKADVYTFFALRSSPTPAVSTCHTWYDNDWMVRLYGAVDRFVLRSYARVVAVTDEVRQRLLAAGVPGENIRLVRNGIDLRPFEAARGARSAESVPGRPLLIGLVGRLAPEKGVDLFIRAAAGVLPHLPHTQFVIVGDGPDRAGLASLIEALGVSASVSLLGRREDMPAFYASLDLMVSASRQEGLPMAILEGMASGLPLVATSVGAVPSVVRDGCTGILVAPENIEALASAMLLLLGNPDRRAQYGAAAARAIAEEFSADRMTSDYLGIYAEAVASRASRSA